MILETLNRFITPHPVGYQIQREENHKAHWIIDTLSIFNGAETCFIFELRSRHGKSRSNSHFPSLDSKCFRPIDHTVWLSYNNHSLSRAA